MIYDSRQKNSTENDELTAVSEVLREIAMLLALCLFSTSVKPSSDHNDDNGDNSDDYDDDNDDAKDVDKLRETSFLEKLEDCFNLLQNEDKKTLR